MTMNDIVCGYCDFGCIKLQSFLQHFSEKHSEKSLYFLEKTLCEQRGKIFFQKKRIDIKPCNLSSEQTISFKGGRFCVLTSNVCEESAAKKRKTDHDTNELDDSKAHGEKLCNVFKCATQNLKDTGYLNDIIGFLQLVSEGKFPLQNIAFQLFIDVVRWYMCTSVSNMRYTDTVKCFWRTGLRLFKGKFHRFMSGLRNLESEVNTSDCSSLNFCVPDRKLLSSSQFNHSFSQPGVLTSILDTISKEQDNSCRAFKLAVDLKKLNYGGKMGDIDIFGLEKRPTLQERQTRLKNELDILDKLREILPMKNSESLALEELHSSDKQILSEGIGKLLTVGANRLRDLREITVKRKLGLERFKSESESNWMKSKHAFILSSIQTSLYQLKVATDSILRDIDGVLEVGSLLSETRHLLATTDSISLMQQENCVCLNNIDPKLFTTNGVALKNYAPYIKQRTETWFDIRKRAKVTGSTAYKALGLKTLRAQKEHFDIVFNKKVKPEIDASLQPILQHGIDNEPNAVATLCSKVLPVLFPQHTFEEVGCFVMENEDQVFAVVSPDDCLSHNGRKQYAVEIKCPVPGKVYSTDVFYEPPAYYVPQMLFEMKSMCVRELIMVCYTRSSSTVFRLRFCDKLWFKIWKILKDVYADQNTCPKTFHPLTKELKSDIKAYLKTNCDLVAEVPSVTGRECHHMHEPDGPASITVKHECERSQYNSITVKQCDEILFRLKTDVQQAYELTRNFAKQVLVVMISDVDRQYKTEVPHAVPCAFALTGYSLTTEQMTQILGKVKEECNKRNINVIAQCFDGAFIRCATRGPLGEPLTRLQLLKDVWSEAKSTAKALQIQHFSKWGLVKDPHVDVIKTVSSTRKCIVLSSALAMLKTPPAARCILTESKPTPYVRVVEDPEPLATPSSTDILSTVDQNKDSDEACIQIVSDVFDDIGLPCNSDDTVNDSGTECDLDETTFADKILRSIFEELKMGSNENRSRKWNTITFDDFTALLVDAKTISKNFQKAELLVCAIHLGITVESKITKEGLVNVVSAYVGDGTTISMSRKQSPNSLRSIVICVISKHVPKEALNMMYAASIFPQRLSTYEESSPISEHVNVHNAESPQFWYSKPCIDPNTKRVLFSYLDPEHLLVNARVKICTSGMPKIGIRREAWLSIAKNNNTGLNYAMVEELLDKQSCAYAKTTFSEDVEREMMIMGFAKEAEFCRLIREWYQAQDEPGLSSLQRHTRDIAMRRWLLQHVDLTQFPPPGSHVNDIPISWFEGMLIHIDRRLQMNAFIPRGTYNVRAIGTLDCENFFGCFQDWDPRGTGILKPSEVPRALEVACELFQVRMSSSRGFVMKTSASRVYPVREPMACDTRSPSINYSPPLKLDTDIVLIDHEFDKPERKKLKPKRKSGTITDWNEPAKGARSLRAEHYHVNEANILPHKRAGVSLPLHL